VHSFSRTTNNRVLNRISKTNHLWVSRHVALDWGLKDGQNIALRNQDGVESAPVPVKVTERIRPDCVYMAHGYGHTARGLTNHLSADDAALVTKYNTDPIMGGTGMNVNYVTFAM
jgi:thiosulfate reductase/polysulfide reductase chain A